MQDEEIIFEPINCAFCLKDLSFLNLAQREAHCENHFMNHVEDRTVKASTDTTIALIPKVFEPPTKLWKFPKEKDVFWYPEQTTVPPSNYTPGLIPLIKKGLLKGQSSQLIRRAVLCNQNTVHIHREAWDAAWGCGYRNFIISCAALMCQVQQPLYFPLLDAPLPPSVRNLQSWIESAWKEGFDIEGQKELKKLVGTSKWIGTADIWVAFSYRGIPAELVDFDLRNSPQGSQALVDWIIDYFSVKETAETTRKSAFDVMKKPQITITEKMPIILQHDRHSRTIIGYEIDKNGALHLLSFDPSFRPPAKIRAAALNEFAQHSSSKKPISSNLKRKRSDDVLILQVKNSGSSKKNFTNMPPPLKEATNSRAENELDLYTMTRLFRLDAKNMSKKKGYQILYFPMTAPLTDYEKSRRKIVISRKLP